MSVNHWTSIDKLIGGSNESTDMNVYQRINKDINATTRDFILRFYQVIPKYYLLSRDQRKIILSYSMGSGKTATAIFIAGYFYNTIKKSRFLSKFGLTPSVDSSTKILVVGSWVTENAFIKDLLQPVFGYASISEMEDINYKRNSTFKDLREEGNEQYDKLIKTIRKSFIFNNFQAVFNKTFPGSSCTQRIDSLFEKYSIGKLVPNEDFLESLRDSLIVVDEFQHMYSTNGMNSYGFVIGVLMKYSKKYNIRFVFMSGTMINNSLYEVPFIMSILNEDTFLDVSRYITEQEIIKGVNVKTLKKSVLPEVYDFFKDYFLYYNQRAEAGLDKEDVNIVECTTDIMKINRQDDACNKKNLKMLVVTSKDNDLPIVRHIGNTIITNQVDDVPLMNLYNLSLSGRQNEEYNTYVSNRNFDDSLTDSLEDSNEDDNKAHARDGVFDLRSVHLDNRVYTGKGLLLENLNGHSSIGRKMVELAINNSLNHEKTVFYHDRIINYGLKQYIEILHANGFIKYGDIPKNNTLCIHCGKTLVEHSLGKGSRQTHEFIPMTYGYLFGDMTNKERNTITSVYNSPNNIYGELISVMFISRVAAAGLNLLHTNNLVIIQRISSISLWKQICGRVIRTKSHSLLPPEKRYVNVYTISVSSSLEHSKKNSLTYDQRYYTIRSIQYQQIETLIKNIYKKSVTDSLFKHQDQLGPSNTTELSLFNTDLVSEIEYAFKCIRISNSLPWSLDNIIKALRNKHSPLSYIDFNTVSDKEIISELVNKRLIRIIELQTTGDRICIPYDDDNLVSVTHNHTISFSFSDLYRISISDINILTYLSKVEANIPSNFNNVSKVGYIRKLLNDLLKLTNFDIGRYSSNPAFWRSIYYIRDEYYIDDNKNFFKNHSTHLRSISKVRGMYCNNTVILDDGTTLLLSRPGVNNKLLEIPNRTNTKYSFSINSYNYARMAAWFLKVVITMPVTTYEDNTVRRTFMCTSCKPDILESATKNLVKFNHRNELCTELLTSLCDYVIKTHQDTVVDNPFTA